ncbi:terminase [Gordonia phage DatBoi]|nr:terminase [Gordonia phage DatBoi]
MPHDVVRAPGHDREKSLGWLAVAWMEYFCVHGPGDIQGEPVDPVIDEYVAFIVDTYAHDANGKRFYDHVFLSRPKGCAKSEVAALIAMFEAFGPCRFDGFAEGGEVFRDPWGAGFEYVYQPGEPMGKKLQTPFIRCMSTTEDQSGLVYDTIYLNLTEGPLQCALPRKDMAGLTRIVIPGGGEIVPSSAGSASKDGGKDTLAIFDETHLYNLPGLRSMYKTVCRNLVKRRKTAGTFAIETTTMYSPGEDSVAEQTYNLVKEIKAGKVKRTRQLFDHRYGDITPEDLTDQEKVRKALIESYGDCTWNDVDGLMDEIYGARDPNDLTSMFRYWFNSPFSAENAWITSWEWNGAGLVADEDLDPDEPNPNPDPIKAGDTIVLGFDGSRKRRKGVTDSTALIGCRVKDGAIFEIEVWEQPPEFKGKDGWEVDTTLVDLTIRQTFKKYRVVGFYADPALWETWVAKWEARYGDRLKLKASGTHPIEWWMTGNRGSKTVAALEEFQNAVLDRELRHFNEDILSAHVLNARRNDTPRGVQIRKENPDSPRKIDAAVAAVLAWQARLDAVAKGIGEAPKKRIARKIR